MATLIFVAVCAWLGGMGLTYIMMAALYQSHRNRVDFPPIRNEQPPIPVCAPNRHATLTGAYQDGGTLIAALERDVREYRMEIRRLRDELAELRFPVAPVVTVSRYNVIDKFAWLEVAE